MLDIPNTIEKRVSECMTSPVVTVGPDDSARTAAEIMLRLHVSGLPVVDAKGRPVGVVSESDFRFADVVTRQEQRDSWVHILSGGQEMAKDYLDALEREVDSVRQIMAAPAICVDEAVGIEEAAALMNEHRIKRLVVLRDGFVVGVVSRADLLRLFAPEAHPPAKPVTPEFFEAAVEEAIGAKPKPTQAVAPAAATPESITAAALKNLVLQFERNKNQMRDDVLRMGKEKRDEQVKLLLKTRFTDQEFAHLLTKAREAAARGETSAPALVFPCALCNDGGRAINLPDPDWPASLRGKAADFFLRWDKELRPLGFALTARIVSFPDGFPGDAELSLAWGR